MQPDIHTEHILPHISLQPFIKYFGVRTMDTLGVDFPKVVHAESEMQLNFFFHCKMADYLHNKNISPAYSFDHNNDTHCYYTGIQTFTKGVSIVKGPTTIITVHFKPVGFFYIFGISPKEIVDKHGETAEIFSRGIVILYEQIENALKVRQGVEILGNYLLKKLSNRKYRYKNPGISAASNMLIACKGNYSIKKLASDCNMTLQTLETNFTDQVGVVPKEFCRLLRFNHVVNMKLYNSDLSWTHIAHSCGFFDQTHLIKDFKKLTSLSPKNFMDLIKPPLEKF